MGTAPKSAGFHHVAYACRDVEATRHFYEDLLGMPLVHTEVKREGEGSFRHLFFDTGDGSCIAFFHLDGMGEAPDHSTAVSTAAGFPVWVNHVAFAADEARTDAAKDRLAGEGIVPLMEVDHGWCVSTYWIDPDGIMVEFCRDTGGFGADPAEAAERLTGSGDTDRSEFISPVDPAALRGHDLFPATRGGG